MDPVTGTVLIMGGIVLLVSIGSCVWGEIKRTMDSVVTQVGLSV